MFAVIQEFPAKRFNLTKYFYDIFLKTLFGGGFLEVNHGLMAVHLKLMLHTRP